ncbi:MAG TPA: ankyrin repeat domain-containing protein [Stellaceae bacterium]|jgi:ankyrin repeat protein|nr:ankyrin repeat domain-containing protein [Stellaceae bacterium]
MRLRRGALVGIVVAALCALAPAARALDLNPFGEYYKNIPRAAAGNDVGRIRQLLGDGYSPNQTDENGGTTGLHIAAASGNLQIIAILYKAGADINQKDNVGSTPLDYAAEHGHLDAAKLLLDMKARVDDQNKNGMTPLMFAAKTGDIELVRAILARGANPNLSDYTGRDAAGWALESHRPMVVQTIKEAQKKH